MAHLAMVVAVSVAVDKALADEVSMHAEDSHCGSSQQDQHTLSVVVHGAGLTNIGIGIGEHGESNARCSSSGHRFRRCRASITLVVHAGVVGQDAADAFDGRNSI